MMNVLYENAGKCVEVIDGNTIQVYGVGKVQLSQVKTPQKNESGFSDAKKFVEDKCLGSWLKYHISSQVNLKRVPFTIYRMERLCPQGFKLR